MEQGKNLEPGSQLVTILNNKYILHLCYVSGFLIIVSTLYLLLKTVTKC